jgi:glutathione S-transferase
MKHQLYYYPGNANLAPHILLEEAGCEVELLLVDRAARAQKSAEYLRLNPNGRIPTLVCGDLVVFEMYRQRRLRSRVLGFPNVGRIRRRR